MFCFPTIFPPKQRESTHACHSQTKQRAELPGDNGEMEHLDEIRLQEAMAYEQLQTDRERLGQDVKKDLWFLAQGEKPIQTKTTMTNNHSTTTTQHSRRQQQQQQQQQQHHQYQQQQQQKQQQQQQQQQEEEGDLCKKAHTLECIVAALLKRCRLQTKYRELRWGWVKRQLLGKLASLMPCSPNSSPIEHFHPHSLWWWLKIPVLLYIQIVSQVY